jgi:hypothetical protein
MPRPVACSEACKLDRPGLPRLRRRENGPDQTLEGLNQKGRIPACLAYSTPTWKIPDPSDPAPRPTLAFAGKPEWADAEACAILANFFPWMRARKARRARRDGKRLGRPIGPSAAGTHPGRAQGAWEARGTQDRRAVRRECIDGAADIGRSMHFSDVRGH